MRSSTIYAAAGLVLAQAAAASLASGFAGSVSALNNIVRRAVKPRQTGNGCSDPGSYNEDCDCCGCTCASPEYLEAMCYPDDDEYDYDTEMYPANSTAPCEVYSNQYVVCAANGTAEIDLIAEQECLCNGGFFEYMQGCTTCFVDHGAVYDSNELFLPANAVSQVSSQFCTGTPQTDFVYIYDSMFSTYPIPTSTATGTDLFPNMTAVSLYFTATGSTQVGEITGSATLATYSYDSAFGGGGSQSTVTDGLASGQTTASVSGQTGTSSTSSVPAILASPSIFTSTSTSASSGPSSSSSSSASTSASAAAAANVKVAGGLLAAGLFGVGLVL